MTPKPKCGMKDCRCTMFDCEVRLVYTSLGKGKSEEKDVTPNRVKVLQVKVPDARTSK